ncbi:uncharacterized protein RHIMIDRAFT_237232 [Rhizopus microsporus ATCC 52813]|uniref:Uncharacterized protein n=1 Tax=Rhizopus microsporus ATCC 52813 TaxID=1340429 RepID=A0A2G4SXW5_RHIZD|nr:uncharacterized protein RHIMIDRAFT_237232 [Rhizopus microsporus ATCC 52813]PHZ13216.1 hypothetical protein RHIMIDRAFT_237232 [Rhizopus microsporus ATCC 52813]
MRDQVRSILKAMYERKKQIENEKHQTSSTGKAKRKRMSQAEKIENKKEKKKAKYDHNDEQEKDIVCTSCHQKEHKNARSSSCPNRKLTKQEELQQLMGNRKTATVKTKLETILRPAHRSIKDVRNILVRACDMSRIYKEAIEEVQVDESLYNLFILYKTRES